MSWRGWVVGLAGLGLAGLGLGCGESTGGKLIEVPFRVGGLARAAAGPLTVHTPAGWSVTLDSVRIALGPFYFNHDPQSSEQYRNGTFIMQATQQLIVNPLDPTLVDVTGGADGETGTASSVEIDLLPVDGSASESVPDQALLGPHLAVLTGTATRSEADGGVTTVPFSGPIDVDKAQVTPQTPLAWLQRVPGANASLTFTDAPAELQLRVDPSTWVDIDYASLTVKNASGSFTWTSTSTVAQQLFAGVTTTVGVYQFGLVAK